MNSKYLKYAVDRPQEQPMAPVEKPAMPEKELGQIAGAIGQMAEVVSTVQAATDLQIRTMQRMMETIGEQIRGRQSEYQFDVVRDKDGKISAIHARPV